MQKQGNIFNGMKLNAFEKEQLKKEEQQRVIESLFEDCEIRDRKNRIKPLKDEEIVCGRYMKTNKGRIVKVDRVMKDVVSFQLTNRWNYELYSVTIKKESILDVKDTKIELLEKSDMIFVPKLNDEYVGWVYVEQLITHKKSKRIYALVKSDKGRVLLIEEEHIKNIKTRVMLNDGTHDTDVERRKKVFESEVIK